MAKEFFGMLMLDLETEQDVSPETFKKFKKDFDKMVEDNWEMMLYDLAEKHGFDIDSIHPIMWDSSYPLKEKE
jgi:hypothetical protein